MFFRASEPSFTLKLTSKFNGYIGTIYIGYEIFSTFQAAGCSYECPPENSLAIIFENDNRLVCYDCSSLTNCRDCYIEDGSTKCSVCEEGLGKISDTECGILNCAAGQTMIPASGPTTCGQCKSGFLLSEDSQRCDSCEEAASGCSEC